MPSEQRKRINISLLIPFLVIALVFGLMIWQKYHASREIPTAPQVQQPAGIRTAILFFVADGSRLAREARELETCNETGACVKEVLDALFSGSLGGFSEAIPASAQLIGVSIEGDTAVVNVNRSFAEDLPSGSSAEMLAVYSIVDTVCVNYPQIARVKLTVEGAGSPALRHLDLSDPLDPDYSLEAGPEPPENGKINTPSTPEVKKGKQ